MSIDSIEEEERINIMSFFKSVDNEFSYTKDSLELLEKWKEYKRKYNKEQIKAERDYNDVVGNLLSMYPIFYYLNMNQEVKMITDVLERCFNINGVRINYLFKKLEEIIIIKENEIDWEDKRKFDEEQIIVNESVENESDLDDDEDQIELSEDIINEYKDSSKNIEKESEEYYDDFNEISQDMMEFLNSVIDGSPANGVSNKKKKIVKKKKENDNSELLVFAQNKAKIRNRDYIKQINEEKTKSKLDLESKKEKLKKYNKIKIKKVEPIVTIEEEIPFPQSPEKEIVVEQVNKTVYYLKALKKAYERIKAYKEPKSEKSTKELLLEKRDKRIEEFRLKKAE